ncbi:MAG: hypothetical protein AB7F09_16985 [Parvibaculaceae bacterium]
MLHHASFNVRHPASVAGILAEMLVATALRAPSPPFPPDSWFVLYGDEAGSFIEILPWGAILMPEARFGVGQDGAMRPHAGSHVLLSTPRSEDEIRALAESQGWLVQLVDARLFTVLKVWIDNTTLIELLTPAMRSAYVRTFGSQGLASLDGKLRALEGPPS